MGMSKAKKKEHDERKAAGLCVTCGRPLTASERMSRFVNCITCRVSHAGKDIVMFTPEEEVLQAEPTPPPPPPPPPPKPAPKSRCSKCVFCTFVGGGKQYCPLALCWYESTREPLVNPLNTTITEVV